MNKEKEEVKLRHVIEQAEREDKIRGNRIYDRIPGLNTGGQLRDTREAKQVEWNSYERIVREENADHNFRQRRDRIVYAINTPQYQQILVNVKGPERNYTKVYRILQYVRKYGDKQAQVLVQRALDACYVGPEIIY